MKRLAHLLDPATRARFWRHVHEEPNSGCWLWDCGLMRWGHGKMLGLHVDPHDAQRWWLMALWNETAHG